MEQSISFPNGVAVGMRVNFSDGGRHKGPRVYEVVAIHSDNGGTTVTLETEHLGKATFGAAFFLEKFVPELTKSEREKLQDDERISRAISGTLEDAQAGCHAVYEVEFGESATKPDTIRAAIALRAIELYKAAL